MVLYSLASHSMHNALITFQMILKLQTITHDREQQMEKLWKEFQDILNDYLHQTEEYHNEYIELRQRDDEDTKIIRLHYADVTRATEVIGALKLDLDCLREEQSLHVEELLKYKKLLQEKQRKIKLEMDEGLLKDKNNLRYMVVCSHDAAAVSLFHKSSTFGLIFNNIFI